MRIPPRLPGHVVAGWLYQDRGDDASAIEAFERVLELDDENGAALRSLAGLVEATRGLSYAERLVELEPDDARSLATLEELRATVAASAEPEAGAVPFDEPAAAAQPVAAEPAPPDSSVGDASAGAIPVEDLAPGRGRARRTRAGGVGPRRRRSRTGARRRGDRAGGGDGGR